MARGASTPHGRGAGASGGSQAQNSSGTAAPARTGATGIFPPGYVGLPTHDPTQAPGRGYPGGPAHGPSHGHGGGRPPGPPDRRLIDYPRRARYGWTRWIPSWKLVCAIVGTGFAFVIVGLLVAYASTSIPSEDKAVQAQTTTIYYSDGTTEIGRFATQNRQNVQLGQVPVAVQHAVLAAEDHTFYSNSGVDPTSIIRAAWSNARGNSLQGGSTITQQYVKNVYDERDRSAKRKVKEVFLALKINRQVSKDDILARYLNTIYLGRSSYGIQAASKAYFNKDVSKLTVSQGAFLAGIINAPSLADPRDGTAERARAERRWNVVLDAMVTGKWLSPEDRAKQKFPKTIEPRKAQSLKGQKGYLMEMVQAEAARLGWDKQELQTGGFNIVTTFNKRLIDEGVKAVKEQLPDSTPKGLRVGMVAIDPGTGAVRAIYGGRDYFKEINQATLDKAQAGSTFKPFALAAALEDGYSLKTVYNGRSPLEIKGVKKPFVNFGGENPGYVDLVKATEESVNTVFIQLNKDVGADKTAAAAIAAGIPKTGANVKPNLANVLGTADPHTIDMASAYATFAAGGIYRRPYVIQSASKVETGKEFWKAPRNKGTQVFSKPAMADLTYAMTQVIEGSHGTGTYAQRMNRPVAGKTGTSTSSMSAWFVGFTPQLATAVSMHKVDKDGRTPIEIKGFGQFNAITGGSYPVRIWTAFMQAALEGKPVEDFPEPTYAGEIKHQTPATQAPLPPVNPTSPPNPTSSPTPSSSPTTTRKPRPTRTIPLPTFTLPGTPGAGADAGSP